MSIYVINCVIDHVRYSSYYTTAHLMSQLLVMKYFISSDRLCVKPVSYLLTGQTQRSNMTTVCKYNVMCCVFSATNGAFRETLKQIESSEECGGLPMISFLILPMQRVTRLPLLMDVRHLLHTRGIFMF